MCVYVCGVCVCVCVCVCVSRSEHVSQKLNKKIVLKFVVRRLRLEPLPLPLVCVCVCVCVCVGVCSINAKTQISCHLGLNIKVNGCVYFFGSGDYPTLFNTCGICK